MTLVKDRLCIGSYFSDTIELLDPASPSGSRRSVGLRADSPFSVLRQGELNFNDATLSFQGWQSCATCHSEDGRVDGLNWDLLNDGIGTPKNTRSLLLAHRTPPAMSTGARVSAEAAVRAGLEHVLFAVPSERIAVPLDEWLKSFQPIPSPHLVNGQLSAAAQRGEAIFNSPKTGCAGCHKPELFTDLTRYDVGTGGPVDHKVREFYTPTLIEIWRTAPYLHDGSAATIRDVLTTRNKGDQHGQTSHLSEAELNDLSEYLLSL